MLASPQWRILFICLGILALIVGVIGIFLPLLPTTPFVILSAYFFSKGSEKIYRWLISQPQIGQAILDWEKNKRIRRPVKIKATMLILITFSLTLILVKVPLGVKAMIASVGVFCLILIWTRAD